jgi:hypothetical protein
MSSPFGTKLDNLDPFLGGFMVAVRAGHEKWGELEGSSSFMGDWTIGTHPDELFPVLSGKLRANQL